MEINVLIVDDTPSFGKIIDLAVSEFESSLEGVTYKSHIIAEDKPYQLAAKYIEGNQNKIDIMLFDYNIDPRKDGYKGTDLFALVDTSRFLIYKILHSVTSKSHTITKEQYKVSYNEFCYSKSEEDIVKELQKYENDILSIKLFGNTKYRNKYFHENGTITKNAQTTIFDDVRAVDILYAQTDGLGTEEITVFFRDISTGGISSKFKPKGIKALKHILEPNDKLLDLAFVKINNFTLVNMLWVADIDMTNAKVDEPGNTNTIRFISIDNSLCEIIFQATGPFKKDLSSFLTNLKTIPPFLKEK